MRRRLFVALAILLSLQAGGRAQLPSTARPPATVLRPGVAVDGTLDAEGKALYEIALEEGDAIDLRATQPDGDLEILLLDRAGQELAGVNIRRPQQGDERLVAVAPVTATFVVSVGKPGPTSTATRFSLTSTRRRATAADRRWADGARAFVRGVPLAETRTRDGLEGALPLFREAHGAWSAIDARLEASTALSHVATVQVLLSQLQDARAGFEAAAALSRAIGDRSGEGYALDGLGATYARLGDYEKAAAAYEQAVVIRRAIGDAGLGYSLIGLAAMRGRSVDGWPGVVDAYQEALTLFERNGNRRAQVEALYNLAYAHRQLSAFDRAAWYFDRALALARELDDPDEQARILNQVALTLLHLGDPQRALEILDEVLPLRRRAGDRRGEGYTLQAFGIAFTQMKDWPAAIERLTAARQVFDAVNDREGQVSALMYVAHARGAMGAPAEALDLARQALQINGERLTLSRPVLWSVIGNAHLSVGDAAKAADAFGRALADAERLQEPSPAARALAGLGHVARARGDLDAARRHFLDAVARIESVRAAVPQSELRASFLAATQPTYEAAIETLAALHGRDGSAGHAAEALAISERRRARALLELIAQAQADLRAGADAALVAKEEDIQHQLNLRAAEPAAAANRTNEAGSREHDRVISGLVSDLRDVREAIRRASPRYAAVAHPEPLDLPRIQQLLDHQTVLLEYSLGETTSHLWAVTPETMTLHELPGRAAIEVAAARARDLIANSARRTARAPLQRALDDLGTMLLGGVAGRLANKRVAIVADGVLQFLPFGALPVPAGRAGSAPLVVEHEIVMLPSASALSEIRRNAGVRRQRPRARGTVAVLADPVFRADDPRVARPRTNDASRPAQAARDEVSHRPPLEALRGSEAQPSAPLERLPYTREEARAIAARASRQSMTALGFDATRDLALSPAIRDFRIVHFATHTRLDARHPELSGIVLSLLDQRGAPVDGVLRLHDIFNLETSADIVVLSACETALGADVRGEGLIGLARGFMYAGASQVVASLWKVNDRATAELMDAFYAGLLERGLAPAAALRAAQVTLMKQPRWQAPVYWAGFTVQGDWRATP